MTVVAVTPAAGQTRPRHPRTTAACASWIFTLTILLHALAALYLVLWIAIITFITGPDGKITGILWPQTTTLTYVFFVCLHVGAIGLAVVRRCRLRHRIQSKGSSDSPLVDQVPRSELDNYADEFYIVFNLVEIACQSHQAYTLFDVLPEHSKAISYLVVVILYSFVSPLILFVRNTRVKTTLINLADSIFSYALSCGHPMFALVLCAFEFVFLDPNINHNNLLCTNMILLARTQTIGDRFDYACKVAMHVGTFIALYRVTRSLELDTQSYSSITDSRQPRLSLPKLKLLRLNLYVNVAWGCLLTAVLVRSLVSGQPCPPTCVANVRPLFDDTCQCAYVNINCKLVNITDPISFLNTSAIGTHLLYLEIRRCDLPTGLPPAALAPFPSLEKIIVLYSHMETWDGPLPPSVMSLMIRFSHLRTIPRALHVNVPPQLVALVLEACFIPSIPDSVIRAWSTVERLYLLNISLQALPSSLATTLP
ncbi:hypothetical protein As57867_004152, partial [Aphanomyces stellatus]